MEDSMKKNESRAVSDESHLFVEHTEALDCIQRLPDDAALERLRTIFDKYLECPTLLDPSLETMVQQLAQQVQENLSTSTNDNLNGTVRYSLSALYALSKVRGRKCIQRFLPHGVEDVEPVWKALESAISLKDSSSTPPLWESIYMLWNWMGVLSLVPFDCTLLADQQWIACFVKTARQQLSEAGPIRETAAACLASWLSRPDLEQSELPNFISWSRTVIQEYIQNKRELFRVLGILQTLTTILKLSLVSRERLVQHMSSLLWDPLLHLGAAEDNLLLRKFLVKWWTRMSCAYLPPRIAPWRYQRGKRCLVDNLQQQPCNKTVTSEVTPSIVYDCQELFDVPDQVEDATGRVIEALGHSSTVVRWSAAKGVGRITERLPALCAEDVLDAVLEYFDDVEKDKCWHGACLSLAELARRGLLLPSRLGDVVPYIVRAVHYDLRRGQSSVGAHVRDAACYSYWAFARAYSPDVLRPYVKELSESIVLTSLFDREVNCRRAASAAFQEAVGRQGASNFPHGIAILTTADYFSLGNRGKAYTSIAWSVAEFEQYRRPIIRHLYNIKLFHWDAHIRTFASKSLHGMTSLDPSFVAGVVVPFLLEKCLDQRNLHIRHGAVLGVAEVVLALAKPQSIEGALSEENLGRLVALVPEIEKKRLYRGRGGEVMRSAVCRLVECMAIAKVPLTVRDQVRLLDSVDASIPHPSDDIQESACKALYELMITYFPVGEKGPSDRLQKRVVDKFTKIASEDDNPAATRGYTLALGYLPKKLLASSPAVLSSVLRCLQKTARYDSLVGGESDAETRRNSIFSLMRIIDSVGVGPPPGREGYPAVGLDYERVKGISDTFFLALDDYKTDRRGDVGSWCRAAAMDGLVRLMFSCVRASKGRIPYLDELTSIRVICSLLKQLSEKLDSVRQRAGDCLRQVLLAEDSEIFDIPQKAKLVDCLGLADTEIERNWADPSFVFPRVVKTMSLTIATDDRFVRDSDVISHTYYASVVAGLVVSAGGLTESVAKSAFASLLEYAKRERGTAAIEKLGNCLLHLMACNHGVGRVMLPLLKTLDKLLTHRCLDDLVSGPSNFADLCREHLQQEQQDCRDVHRLLSIVNVSVALLISSPSKIEVRRRILALLCKMVGHAFPRVRSHTAQQLYMLLLEHPKLQGDSDAVLGVIVDTPWASDLASIEVEKSVDDVAKSLHVSDELATLRVQ